MENFHKNLILSVDPLLQNGDRTEGTSPITRINFPDEKNHLNEINP